MSTLSHLASGRSVGRTFLILVLPLLTLLAFAHGVAKAEVPDPMERGDYTFNTMQTARLGLVTLHEPASAGSNPTGASSEITLQVRGTLTYPTNREQPSPIIVLVHGNHSSCDSGSAPACTIFKRNDTGYAYMAENLASWGYTVFSLDQDQMMSRQDNPKGKGMHQRRLLIAAVLDALYEANEGNLFNNADVNVEGVLDDSLDFTRIGLMGHSRGGDAVTSFMDYNRMRPEPGRRYPLRGVISLAPVDYERKAPYGSAYLSVLPWCDGDVSNLQGARFYERSQYIKADDPFPRIQSSQLGANHNWYNSTWFADGDDSTGSDPACGPAQANGIRLAGGNYVINNSDKENPEVNTRISGDPARMGDQMKIGLASMNAFFRRYVGGEGAFEPYMTGELSATDDHLQIPAAACPVSASGVRMPCVERVSTSYFPAPNERLDVIRPEADNPLTVSAVGTSLKGSGFASPYLAGGGILPVPPATPGGYDWCNPEPTHFAPSQLGVSGRPTAAKGCPLPADGALGGQAGVRENAPVNHSYGRQLALAWEMAPEDPQPATLETTIPAKLGDVSGFKSLTMGADVNFFDTRNPVRTTAAYSDPSLTTQDFLVTVTDKNGNTGVVNAGNPRYGNALHQSTGNNTNRLHIVLDQIRIPLEDFAEQDVDLTAVRKIELVFGAEDMPQSGSIQLADVRFQELDVEEPLVLSDGLAADGAGSGPPETGPDPAEILAEFDRSPGNLKLPDTVGIDGSPATWTVDDDGEQCPSASFTTIQDAVDYAAPWDTIVVCEGVYQEQSTPVNQSSSNPVQAGSRNGLTITKPLKIKGAGADKVTIMPHPSLGETLAGTVPNLRDGGGHVITVSRQSLGSSDTNEHFVDISGVTVTSPDAYVEAGIGFLNAAGRISDSVVGPIKRAANAGQLAARPHGWGVIMVGSIIGVGPGTVERDVIIEDSIITGYQAGGVLFDSARGVDGNAANTQRSGIKDNGFVKNTVVQGSGPHSLIAQTGIRYHAGATGYVTGSKIAGNLFPTDQRQSVGILLTDAKTESWYAKNNVITGNGYGLFNANITNDAVRIAAPANAVDNWWGPSGPPVAGPSIVGFGIEGISGLDSPPETPGDPPTPGVPAPSVTFDPTLDDEPASPPAPFTEDAAPFGDVVEAGEGEPVSAEEEETITPVVKAGDDFAVKSVALTVDGEIVDTVDKVPYEFEWGPTLDQAGSTVEVAAIVTDSSGQTSVTGAVDVEVAELTPVPPVTVDAPVLTGTAQVGQELSCSTGTWEPDATGYAYVWYADGDELIEGAESATLLLAEAQIDHTIGCAVVASNEDGSSEPALSNTVGPVVPADEPPILTPNLVASSNKSAQNIGLNKTKTIRIIVTNSGDGEAESVKVCANTSNAKLSIKPKCQTIGTLAPGATVRLTYTIKVKGSAKGKTTKAKFQVTSANAPLKNVSTTVKIKR